MSSSGTSVRVIYLRLSPSYRLKMSRYRHSRRTRLLLKLVQYRWRLLRTRPLHVRPLRKRHIASKISVPVAGTLWTDHTRRAARVLSCGPNRFHRGDTKKCQINTTNEQNDCPRSKWLIACRTQSDCLFGIFTIYDCLFRFKLIFNYYKA